MAQLESLLKLVGGARDGALLRYAIGTEMSKLGQHGPNVKRRLYRVQLKLCARNPGAIGHRGARNNRPHQLGAGRV